MWQKPSIVILGDNYIHWITDGDFSSTMETVTNKTQSAFSKNLTKTYSWFDVMFTPRIKDAFVDFFGFDVNLKLFSVSENENVLFRGDRYFVTSIKYKKNLPVTFRLSQGAVSCILDKALGESETPFVIEKLSELEAKVISTFNDYIMGNIKKHLIPAEKFDKNEQPKSVCNLVYYVDFSNNVSGKLVVSLPTNIIAPQEVVSEGDAFTIGSFKNSTTALKVLVGSSKLTLGEVKSLQVEDVLLLEDSNIYTMTLCKDKELIPFKLSPDPSIILNTDNDEGVDMTQNTSSANIWDSIQVDINAEFEKVKISLGELKQISEGLVVDIGSIYDNRIDLKVENKLVARGELVIINDRYGVRIDEVVEDDAQEEVVLPQPQHTMQQEEVEVEEEDFEDDDFNYDDFDEENEI